LALLDALLARPLCKVDIEAYLRQSKTIGDPARRKALLLLPRYREEKDPERYHQAARTVVRQRYYNPFQFRFALLQAEAACRLVPNNELYRTTLGIAEYRNGKYQEALDTLTRAEQQTKDLATNLAFRAMAQYKLAHKDKAHTLLDRARDLVKDAHHEDGADVQSVLVEAKALIEDKAQDEKR
jgi:tetratricopeptide (TPR) repeat protein